MRSFALFAVVLFCVAADVDAQATTLPNTVLNYGCVKELLGTCEESCPTCICPVIEPARTPCRCEGAKIDNAHCCRDKHPESRCHIFVCKDWVWQCEEGCH